MAEENKKEPECSNAEMVGAVRALIIVLVVIGIGAALGLPWYGVYRQGLRGEAELARAKANRQIAVQEAEAKKESARMLAEAEVERAKGVAQANKIIGDSLHGNEAYLRYLWIQGLHEGANPQVVYIPTEAGLPILEAGRIPNMRTRPAASARDDADRGAPRRQVSND
jgi:type II secretory pathway pseudopilin PulG